MEMELRRLEDLAESIVNDFAYMRAREQEMRDTNGMPVLFSTPLSNLLCRFRINQLSCPVLQCLLYGLPGVPRCLADFLPSSFLPSEETDRVVNCLPSLQVLSPYQHWQNEGFHTYISLFIVISFFQRYFAPTL